MTINIQDTVYSTDGDIYVVTRIHNGQVYGLPCTGPLNNSTNADGDLNEYAFTPENNMTTTTKNTHQLNDGDIVHAHGHRFLLSGGRESLGHRHKNRIVKGAVEWYIDHEAAAVMAFDTECLTGDFGFEFTVQGNDLAKWAVED